MPALKQARQQSEPRCEHQQQVHSNSQVTFEVKRSVQRKSGIYHIKEKANRNRTQIRHTLDQSAWRHAKDLKIGKSEVRIRKSDYTHFLCKLRLHLKSPVAHQGPIAMHHEPWLGGVA